MTVKPAVAASVQWWQGSRTDRVTVSCQILCLDSFRLSFECLSSWFSSAAHVPGSHTTSISRVRGSSVRGSSVRYSRARYSRVRGSAGRYIRVRGSTVRYRHQA